MSIYDDPSAEAADLHNFAETGGTSYLEKSANFIAKGIPLAVGSGLVSMYNTAAALGNSVGGDFEKVDYLRTVKEFDDNLGLYYQEHKEGVDLGGFVATSFIPGLGGVKALKLIQSGGLGKSAAAATGLFRSAEERYLGKALSSIQQETNQVFRALDGNKLAAIAAGTADQVLQAAAWETSVMLTMNQNPTINKEDASYFASLIHNTPEILAGALIGGGIGGGINAFAISGKLKGAIKLRDKDDFPSLNINEIGLSDIDQGTAASIDFKWLKGREREYKQKHADGKINERQLANYEKTQEQKATELLTRIREELTEDKDAALSKAVWNHLTGLDNSADSEQVAIQLLAAATKVSRIAEDDAIAVGTKILYEDGFLSERHARNLVKNRQKQFSPEPIDPTDKLAVEEAKIAGYEWFKDPEGNLRVISGTKYASTLEKKLDTKKHDFIVKVAGDRSGQITEVAYPVLGDIGEVEFKRGKLLVNKVEYEAPEFNPLDNSPLQSSSKFLYERLAPKLDLQANPEIELLDLPKLEKAYLEGVNVDVIHPDGTNMGGLLDNPELLREAKLELRQDMINAGHDFKRIARELNTSEEFAETAQGEHVLGMLEKHDQPIHARIDYNTKIVPDKHYLRGVSDLNDRIRLAKEHNSKVSALILGNAYLQLPQTNGTMLGINTLPELGNMVKSADEVYGSFGELMQSVGKIADKEMRRRAGDAMEKIAASHNAIASDETKLIQFNQIVAKLRSSKEPLVLYEDMLIPQSILKIKDQTELKSKLADAVKDFTAVKVEDKDVLAYLTRTQEINATRADLFNHYFSAKGSATSYDPQVMYVPPIDTRKYPFVAFVKEHAEAGFRPTSVISASTAQDLESKIRAVKQQFGDQLGIYTKDDAVNFYKMQGEYESGLMLGNSTVDVSLKKRGVLSDFVPRTDDEILKDFVNWHIQQEQALVRNAVELQYAQEFAELRAMGNTFFEYQKSKFGGRELSAKEFAQLRKDNPYERYITTGLNVSNLAKYDSVWGKLNSAVEGLGQSMFKAWDSAFSKAQKGEVDWITANREAEKLGLRPPYQDMLREVINPVVSDRKIVEPIVAKVNATLASLVLRLDPLNSIVNILGTPGLMAAELASIRKNLSNPDVVGKLSQMLSQKIPGTEHSMPSTMSLISKALGNFVSDDGKYLKYYQDIGAVQSDLQLYKNVLDATQLSQGAMKDATSLAAWSNNVVKKGAELGATLTGNNLSERMVRFVAADIMRQLGEVAGVEGGELTAYINTFVNRVHGNYTASQRPHVFQGAVGQAIGLFQTFQFNVMQNMVRFIETNQKTSVAALLGMQNTLFGLQGNPAFYLLNSAIGNANREHKDLVSGAYASLGQDTADWLLYGLGSNSLNVNLYNRGDLTPRYVTVLPTSITEVPAVSLPAKFLGNIFDTFKAINQGGSISQSIVEGIAKNGVNRPLAGIAQLAQGYRTTAQGNLLISYNEADTMLAAAKIFGGEELNRAIAIDQYYRQVAYKKKDAEKIADVGQALKSKVRSGEALTDSDTHGFMEEYSAAGGNVRTFNRFMVGNYKAANKSQIATMKSSLQTPYARNLASVMGAEDEEMLYRTEPAVTPQ